MRLNGDSWVLESFSHTQLSEQPREKKTESTNQTKHTHTITQHWNHDTTLNNLRPGQEKTIAMEERENEKSSQPLGPYFVANRTSTLNQLQEEKGEGTENQIRREKSWQSHTQLSDVARWQQNKKWSREKVRQSEMAPRGALSPVAIPLNGLRTGGERRKKSIKWVRRLSEPGPIGRPVPFNIHSTNWEAEQRCANKEGRTGVSTRRRHTRFDQGIASHATNWETEVEWN